MSIFTAVNTDHYLQFHEEKIQEGALSSFPDFPWYTAIFQEGEGCFGAFSYLNHTYNLPNRSPEERRLKTFALSLFCFIVGCHSNKISGGASSRLRIVSLCSTTARIPKDWCKLMLEDTRLPVQTCSAPGGMQEAPYRLF